MTDILATLAFVDKKLYFIDDLFHIIEDNFNVFDASRYSFSFKGFSNFMNDIYKYLSIKKYIARIKPIKDSIEPINNDILNGKIEKLVDIFDQSCNIFINVYPDLPWIR